MRGLLQHNGTKPITAHDILKFIFELNLKIVNFTQKLIPNPNLIQYIISRI
jgi:hypothetical protein